MAPEVGAAAPALLPGAERPGNNFDLLRLLLALMVVADHLYVFAHGDLPRWVQYLLCPTLSDPVPVAVWVEGFFVISGYLILASWERSAGLRDYALKRLRRIYPAYAVAVVFAALVGWWATTLPTVEYAAGLPRYFAAQLSFMTQWQNTLPGAFADHAMPAANGALWTLKVEVCFYIALPVLAWCAARLGPAVMLAAAYAASALFFALSRPETGEWPKLALQLPGQLTFFVVGMAAWTWRAPLRRWLLPLLVPMAAIYVLADALGVMWLRPLALGWVVIALATALPLRINAGRHGDFSYGIYIYHFPVIHACLHLGLFSASPLLGCTVSLAATAACAALSWRFVERPFLERRSHYRQASGERTGDPAGTVAKAGA